MARRPIARVGAGFAFVAVFAALFVSFGSSATAIGLSEQDASGAQQRCGQGNVRGIAHVTGGPSGTANIPGTFSGARALFARRFNCTGGAVQVRRTGIGLYEIRFAGNGAPTALAGGIGGSQASADRIGAGTFRVTVSPTGRADPADLPFIVLLV
jgi:hypothetical protein